MASQPKEMKYRRRSRVPEPSEYGQCSERNSGALDWGALKQDPVELLRKLDEIRNQITRSCELTGPPPPERHRVGRRAVSLRPSHAEPPPTGREPEYYRARYAGRYGTSLPPSPYDQLQRPVCDDRYGRQSSGRFRQYPVGQWESPGFAQGGRHHSTCQCAQCLQGQRAMAPEEHILMARYFAGQQGSFRYDRSQPISSELDRRSVASSLYSHQSMSKRRVEYFRKKAESFCRPMRGAAPFVVCSSCNHLLQLPQGKCTSRKKSHVQCGSCSEIVTFKPKEAKVHPFITPSSLSVSRSVGSSNHRDSKNLGWYQHQDEDNSNNFYKLQTHDSHRQKKYFADSSSPSSTASFGRTDSEWGSNRSIQLKSMPAGRSRFSDNPKDILCQGDTDSQPAASVHCTVNPQGPVLEDKQIDPFFSQRKDYNCDEQIRKGYDRNSKADHEANIREEKIDIKLLQTSKEGHKGALEDECNSRPHEKAGRQGKTGSPEEIMGNRYQTKTNSNVSSSPEDEGTRKKYDHNGSFRDQVVNKKYDQKDSNNTLEVESISKRYEQEHNKDDKLPHPDSKKAVTSAKNGSSINECTNSISRVSSEVDVDETESSTAKNGDSSFFGGFLKKGIKDLSLFSQSVDSAKVSVNGHPISERALRKAEKKAGPIDPGSYWYDYRAGFWGVFGRECSGIIPPFIKEFNYPMPKDCAGGNTCVFVNGRELHQKDFDLLVGRGLPRLSGKSYSVEISGSVIDDTTGQKLRGLGKLAPTIEKMKRGFGMHVPEETS